MTTPTVPWDKVIDRLKVGGWVQHHFRQGNKVCLWEAVGLSVSTNAELQCAADKLAKVLEEQWPERASHDEACLRGCHSRNAIIRFNDHKDTKFDDVVLALEKVRADTHELGCRHRPAAQGLGQGHAALERPGLPGWCHC